MSENDPEIQWALDLLTFKPEYTLPIHRKYMIEFWCVGPAILLYPVFNYVNNRPVLHRARMSVVAGLIAYGVSQIFKHYRKTQEAKEASDMKFYILTYPEKFRKKPVKWADVFETWIPHR